MPEQPVPDSESAVTDQLEKTLEKARLIGRADANPVTLHADWLQTPPGPMIIAGDNTQIHLLAFLNDEPVMVRIIAHLLKILKTGIEPGETPVVKQAKRELGEYFSGSRRDFDIPVALNGTSFQLTVWKALRHTPFGTTITYAELANDIGRPSSFRAAAQACAQNPIAILVPCHRVINSNGELGGYLGGLERKAQLLEFEQKIMRDSR